MLDDEKLSDVAWPTRSGRRMTASSQQWRVSRELRERIKVAFEEDGIEIPFPRQTVWHKTPELTKRWDG